MPTDSWFRKTAEIVKGEIIYGGHILSVGGIGMVLTVVLLQRLPIDIRLLAVPYLISQVVYTHNHLRELKYDAESNPERVRHIQGHASWAWLLLVVYIGLLGVVISGTDLATLLLVLVLAGGGILYTEYVKHAVARSIAGLKNAYTAFFWSLVIFLVPVYYHVPVTVPYFYLFAFLFLRCIVTSTFFDLKDAETDREQGIRTLPADYGKGFTVAFLQITNLISPAPLFLGVYMVVLQPDSLSLALVVLYGYLYLLQSIQSDKRSIRILSYVLADGEYALWPFLILLGRVLF